MKVPAKASAGMKACILIGSKWHRCTVRDVRWWSHGTGNDYPVYTVEFRDGTRMNCGNNSLRIPGKKICNST